MENRQVPVEDDDVVAVGGGLLQGHAAVAGHVDGHALPAQAPGDGVGQRLFVFHHQHAHGAMVPSAA